MVKELMNQAIVTGGLTIHKVNGKPEAVKFEEGYQVAKTGINFKDLDKALDHLERLANELEESNGLKESNEWFIGLWHQDGTLYIEPSYHILDRERALKVGAEFKQESIYDWANDDLIWLRYCKITGEPMDEGFYNAYTFEFYKDEEALRQDFTEEEQAEAYKEGWLYWTSWEE